MNKSSFSFTAKSHKKYLLFELLSILRALARCGCKLRPMTLPRRWHQLGFIIEYPDGSCLYSPNIVLLATDDSQIRMLE
jgi:hypothetical protein